MIEMRKDQLKDKRTGLEAQVRRSSQGMFAKEIADLAEIFEAIPDNTFGVLGREHPLTREETVKEIQKQSGDAAISMNSRKYRFLGMDGVVSEDDKFYYICCRDRLHG